MSTTSALLEGLAAYLAAGGVGVWKPDTPYTTDDWAIVIKGVPQTPDRVIVLTLYNTLDGLSLPTTERFVQLRFRRGGKPSDVDDDADAAFTRLHMRHHLTLPSGFVAQRIVRRSTATLGVDDNDRYERTDNYQITSQ